MENSKIEEIEIERFNSLRLRAISFAIWFLGLILTQLPFNNHVLGTIGIIAALFGLLFTYAVLKTTNVFRKIKKDATLNQALMNEMYLNFDYKAVCTGFYSTMLFVILLFLVSNFMEIPGKIVCLSIIYIQVVSTDLRRLSLYKQ